MLSAPAFGSYNNWLITLTSTLIISDITKTEYSNCCITHCFEENTWKGNIASHGTQFDIALENYALRAQHTDKYLIGNHFTVTAYYCQGQRQTGGQAGSSIQDQMLRLPGFLHW